MIHIWRLATVGCLTLASTFYVSLLAHTSSYSVDDYLSKIDLEEKRALAKRHLELKFQNNESEINFVLLPQRLENNCSETKPLGLLVIVLSSADKPETRQAIRETWASPQESTAVADYRARVFFLVGNGYNNSEEIFEEARKHDDVIIIDADDTYENLVYKSFAILHLGTEMCPAELISKIDEDTILHIDRIFKFSGAPFNVNDSAVYGYMYERGEVIRKPDNRWYVSEESFAEDVYPNYCNGPSYLMTAHAAMQILEDLSPYRLITIEDALITGIIAESHNITRVHLPLQFQNTKRPEICYGDAEHGRFLLSKHGYKSPRAIKTGWERMKRECPRPRLPRGMKTSPFTVSRQEPVPNNKPASVIVREAKERRDQGKQDEKKN